MLGTGHAVTGIWEQTGGPPPSCRALGDDMRDQWPLQSSLQLGPLPTAIPCARLHAKHILWEWGLRAVTDTAELLVSELVTNAVKAARGTERKPPVSLRLSADGLRIVIEVWDGNTRPPELCGLGDDFPALEDEGGRGLFLVATLSKRWSWRATQRPQGKIVWCELEVLPQDGSMQGEAMG
jgi:anti-sigma regulatory factor (Ser/Thr protein kinase)